MPDSDTPGSGFVVRAGESTLDVGTMAAAFTAIDASGDSYGHHPTDVALWTALADASPVAAVEPPLDEFDRPVAPASFEEQAGTCIGVVRPGAHHARRDRRELRREFWWNACLGGCWH